MRRVLLFGLMVLALRALAQDGKETRGSKVFQCGEDLRYKVKWNFVRLGTVTIRTLRDSTCTGPNDFKLVLIVESNPYLGFIWIYDWNASLMDANALFAKSFHARHRNGDDCVEIRHVYDKMTRKALFSQVDGNSGKTLNDDTLTDVNPFVDGVSLFFYSRCVSRSNGVWNVPTMVNGKISPTQLMFDGATEYVEIDALDWPVRTRRYTGNAEWVGGTSAGLSGKFTGWMSDDEAAVMVRANMQILLGSINVELEQWSRPGWTPPASPTMSNR